MINRPLSVKNKQLVSFNLIIKTEFLKDLVYVE